MDPLADYPELPDVTPSVVLISPTYTHLRNLRRALEAQRASILLEYNAYPGYAHLPGILDADCDAI